MIARRLIIHGRVQGVFYRNWTVEAARGLGLTGWVRNRSDGTVEILACGEEAAVEALVVRCRQGPPAAAVQRIDCFESHDPCPNRFQKRHD